MTSHVVPGRAGADSADPSVTFTATVPAGLAAAVIMMVTGPSR